MQQKRSYYRGILLWVDDDFIDKSTFFDTELERWNLLFQQSQTKDRVFRLMDLSLVIKTSMRDAIEYIKKLEQPAYSGVFVFAVFDLYLPPTNEAKKTSPQSISEKYGIRIAQEAKRLNIPFVFLSSSSNAPDLMKEAGLVTTPFYQKKRGGYKMPDELVQEILRQFRNNISWLSLRTATQEKVLQGNLLYFDQAGELKNKPTLWHSFPFFGSFRDFVEYSEHRPPISQESRIIARAPRFHSDEFIEKCTLLILHDNVQVSTDSGLLNFNYVKAEGRRDIHQFFDKDILVIRVLPEYFSPDQFIELYRDLGNFSGIAMFVIPDDESGEKLMESFYYERGVLFMNIPGVRSGDDVARIELVRRTLNLAFRTFSYRDIHNNSRMLSDVYLQIPEVLIHPLSWVILKESREIIPSLTDPWEISYEIARAMEPITKNSELLLSLSEGNPPHVEELLMIGVDSFRESNPEQYRISLREHWLPEALHLWLSRSWQFPYNMHYSDGPAGSIFASPDIDLGIWENFSLDVLVNLFSIEDRDYYLNLDSEPIRAAYQFINTPAIRKLSENRASEIKDEEWAMIQGTRWPHHYYPLPVALNKRLKEENRFFWVENDFLDVSRVFPTIHNLNVYTDDLGSLIGTRIKWLKSQLSNLPDEWQVYLIKYLSWIDSGDIEFLWEHEGDDIYKSLNGFVQNSLPLSYILHGLWAGETSESIYKELSSINGYGKPLSRISSFRRSNLTKHFKLKPEVFSSAMNEAYHIFRQHVRINEEFSRFQKAASLNEMKSQAFIDFVNKLKKVDDPGSLAFTAPLLDMLGLDSLTKETITDAIGGRTDQELSQLIQLVRNHKHLFEGSNMKLFDYIIPGDSWENLQSHLNWISKDIIQSDTENVYHFYEGILESLQNGSSSGLNLFRIFNYQAKELLSMVGEDSTNTDWILPSNQSRQHFGFESSYFYESPMEMLFSSIDGMQKLSMTLYPFRNLDGYHFFRSVVQLRNTIKDGSASANKNVRYIRYILELFIHGIEALVAQLKLLLARTGHQELSDRIELCFLNPLELDTTADLSNLIQVRVNEDGAYSMYHLGLYGNGKGKLAVQTPEGEKFDEDHSRRTN